MRVEKRHFKKPSSSAKKYVAWQNKEPEQVEQQQKKLGLVLLSTLFLKSFELQTTITKKEKKNSRHPHNLPAAYLKSLPVLLAKKHLCIFL